MPGARCRIHLVRPAHQIHLRDTHRAFGRPDLVAREFKTPSIVLRTLGLKELSQLICLPLQDPFPVSPCQLASMLHPPPGPLVPWLPRVTVTGTFVLYIIGSHLYLILQEGTHTYTL